MTNVFFSEGKTSTTALHFFTAWMAYVWRTQGSASGFGFPVSKALHVVLSVILFRSPQVNVEQPLRKVKDEGGVFPLNVDLHMVRQGNEPELSLAKIQPAGLPSGGLRIRPDAREYVQYGEKLRGELIVAKVLCLVDRPSRRRSGWRGF